MKSLIVKIVVGLFLFAGSLVGGLAATGRLTHEGTANIPLLGSFFPEPKKADGEHGAGEGKAADPAHAAPLGETANADHKGEAGAAKDASHTTQDPQGVPGTPRKQKTGRSVVQPEPPPAEEGHGGGHGEAPAKADDHGAAKETEKPGEAEHTGKPDGHGQPAGDASKEGQHAVEKDFQQLEHSLATDPKNKYAPGGYFKFDGMPAGLTPEQINEAWQRVQGVLGDIDRRKMSLDLRDQELQELADDVGRRQKELGDERLKIEQEHRRLDARIQKFQEQVKLVRSDEVTALKRNAQTLASFEASKAAELVLEQWKTDRGQDDVLKLMEFMDKDAVNDILKALPGPMVQDLLKKRLHVSKETAPSGAAKK